MDKLVLVFTLAVGFSVGCSVLMLLSKRRAQSEDKVLHEYFLMGLSGLMAKLAMADGKVTGDEVDVATGFFNGMKISEAEKALCIGNFIHARHDGLTARDHARRFLAYGNPVACEFLYSLLWKLSFADGVQDDGEVRLLEEIAADLGLDRSVFERAKAGERPSYDAASLRACGVPASLAALG